MGKKELLLQYFFLLIVSLMQCNQQNFGEALWLQYKVALPKKKFAWSKRRAAELDEQLEVRRGQEKKKEKV